MDRENLNFNQLKEGEYGQRYFTVADDRFVDNRYALDLSLLWPDGSPKSENIFLYELKYGPIFRRGETVFGIQPGVEYPKAQDELLKFFSPFLTFEEIRRFEELTQTHEILVYRGREAVVKFNVLLNGENILRGPRGMKGPVAITHLASWPHRQGETQGILILLNLDRIEKQEGDMFGKLMARVTKREDVDYDAFRRLVIQPIILRMFLAHELLHHLLAIAGIDYDKQRPLEHKIEEFTTRIVMGAAKSLKQDMARRLLGKIGKNGISRGDVV